MAAAAADSAAATARLRCSSRHGFATLLLDLLTRAEEVIDVRTAQYRFDIDLLAARVVAATGWVRRHPGAGSLPIGYFGASTGAAAALTAAAELPQAATHLFEEPGTLEQVMRLAADWFGRYVGRPDSVGGTEPGET